jgi:hypothetical protein
MKKISILVLLFIAVFVGVFMSTDTSAFTSNRVDNQVEKNATFALKDPSFEAVMQYTSGGSGYGYTNPATPGPNWYTTDSSKKIELQYAPLITPIDGTKAIELNSYSNASVYQDINLGTLPVGETWQGREVKYSFYQLSANEVGDTMRFSAGAPGVNAYANEIETVVAGVAGVDKYVSADLIGKPVSQGWKLHEGSFKIPDNFTGNTLRVAFSSISSPAGTGRGNKMDYVRFSTSAEPVYSNTNTIVDNGQGTIKLGTLSTK